MLTAFSIEVVSQREEEMKLLARELVAEFHDLEKKEEEFVLDKTKIRLVEGCSQPINIFVKHCIDFDIYTLNSRIVLLLLAPSVASLSLFFFFGNFFIHYGGKRLICWIIL